MRAKVDSDIYKPVAVTTVSAIAAGHGASQIGVRRILHGKLAGRGTTDEVGESRGTGTIPGDELWQNT